MSSPNRPQTAKYVCELFVSERNNVISPEDFTTQGEDLRLPLTNFGGSLPWSHTEDVPSDETAFHTMEHTTDTKTLRGTQTYEGSAVQDMPIGEEFEDNARLHAILSSDDVK